MKKVNRKYAVLFLMLFIILSIFLLFHDIVSIVGNAIIDGWVTQETTTLSLTVVLQENNAIIPASGNLTFSNAEINARITSLTGLTGGQEANITLYGAGFPSIWSERQPNSSEVGSTKIEFIDIYINATTAGGSYNVHFNVTQAELGSLDAENISLLVFNETGSFWQNMSTQVVNGTSDPAHFYGITSHFSKFLIAQKPAVSSEGGGGQQESPKPSVGAAAASGGGGGGGGVSKAPPENLFDVKIELEDVELTEGDIVKCNVDLIQVRGTEQIDVQVQYTVFDKYKNEIFKQTETRAVYKELSYNKILDELKLLEGEYTLRVDIYYGDKQKAFAQQKFKVLPKPVHIPGLFFDVSMQILEKYRKVLAGEDMITEVNITKIKNIGTVSVPVEYTIEDRNGTVLFTEIETKTIENHIHYLKEIHVSKDIAPKVYMLFVRVKYKDDVGLAGYPFEVIEGKTLMSRFTALLLFLKQFLQEYSLYLISLLLFIIILLLIIYLLKRRRVPHLVYIRKNNKEKLE